MSTREQASTGFTSPPHTCQPGCVRLLAYLMAKFKLANAGCYNPDSVLSSGAPSWHVYGKAIDLGSWWYDAVDHKDGLAAWAWVMANRESLSLQQMIYGNMIVDVRDGYQVRRYTGGDHYNHIHVAIGYRASQDWQPPASAPPVKPKKVLMNFIQVVGIPAIAVTDGVNGKRIFKTPHEFATAQWLCGVQGGNTNITFVDKEYWDSLPTLN